jgi:hypothetical protein
MRIDDSYASVMPLGVSNYWNPTGAPDHRQTLLRLGGIVQLSGGVALAVHA